MFFETQLARKQRILKAYDALVLIKKPHEIEHIRKACSITSKIYELILENDLKVGQTEKQIAAKIYDYSQEMLAEKKLAFDTIAGSGPNSSYVHSSPTDRKIEAGDIVQFDLGVSVNGYCSDLSRVVFMGSKADASKKKQKMLKLVKTLQAEGVERLKRHEEFGQIGRWIVEAFKEKDLHYFYLHSLGHGVGKEIHEFPGISPKTKEGLIPRAGMVVTIEPGLYFPSKFGCRIEDTVLVTSDGAEVLTTATKKLYIS